VAEFFRGESFELPAREAEIASLKWESLESDALEAEFLGAWKRLFERFRHERINQLLQKSREHGWSPADKEEYRRLQQPADAE
jgi:hypothetical protein